MVQSDPSPPPGVTRRHVLTHLAAAGTALAVGFTPRAVAASPQDLHHIVLVTMENRSFDQYFGLYPGADGASEGGTLQCSNGLRPGETIPLKRAPYVMPTRSRFQPGGRRGRNGALSHSEEVSREPRGSSERITACRGR